MNPYEPVEKEGNPKYAPAAANKKFNMSQDKLTIVKERENHCNSDDRDVPVPVGTVDDITIITVKQSNLSKVCERHIHEKDG